VRALVTGGCGFLGRHYVEALASAGAIVDVVDDLSSGLRPEEWLPTEYRDNVIMHEMDLGEWLRERGSGGAAGLSPFDLVVHLAAYVGGRVGIEHHPTDQFNNIALDAQLMTWIADGGADRLVYLSSSAVYPVELQVGEGIPLTEEMVQFHPEFRLGLPDMIYGWSKLNGEYLASVLAERTGVAVLCARPFSGYGPDQSPDYPMTAICQRAVNREDPLVVWGDGNQGRDFVWVDDIVSTTLGAVAHLEGFQVLNVGTGVLTTFLELAEIAADVVGYSPEIRALGSGPVGVNSRVAARSIENPLLLRHGVSEVIRSLAPTSP
jgi:GDP-L-fucose synthase